MFKGLIKIKSQQRHIHADQRLAFQVLSAFGAKTEDGSSSEVLKDEGQRKLVRFMTPFSIFGRTSILVSDEWVTLEEPHAIRFSLVKAQGLMGRLSDLEEAFLLNVQGGCVDMVYESRFRVRFGIIGWFIGRVFVRPVMRNFMGSHLAELKETIEARAKRSKVYPQSTSCTVQD